jgi:hypothetical protein
MLLSLCAVAGITGFVHLRSLEGEILGWDDSRALVENTHWRGLGWDNIKYDFTATDMQMYRPLTWLSYGADYVRTGMDARGFHLTNLLLHVAVACALWAVSLRWLKSLAPETDGSAAAAIAALVALAFSLHPLRVGVVAWLSARADLLAALFLLLASLAWLRWMERRGGTASRLLWHLLFAASLLSKPMALGAPLGWWLVQRWWRARREEAGAEARPASLIDLGVGLLLSAAVTGPLLLAKGAVSNSRAMPELPASAAFASLHNAVFPLWKTLWPFRLGFYEPAYPFNPFAGPYVLGAIAAAALLGLVFWLRRRLAGLAVVAAVYLLLIAPVLGFIPFGYELVADRFSYVPALAWSVALAVPMAAATMRWNAQRRWMWLGALVTWLGAMSFLSWKQTAIWKSNESYWLHNWALNPNSALANAGMGDMMLRQNRIAEAKRYYERTRELLPTYAPVNLGLGFIDLVENRPHQAIEKLSIYLRNRPDHRAAREWIMHAYERAGKKREAEAVRQMLKLEDELESRRR